MNAGETPPRTSLRRESTIAFACGSGSDMFNSDDPATQHAHLVTTLRFGGVTIALLALAVRLAVVEMRRRGLSLRPVRTHLVLAAVSGVTAVVLAFVPATNHWCVIPGVVCAGSFIACYQRIMRIPSTAWPKSSSSTTFKV